MLQDCQFGNLFFGYLSNINGVGSLPFSLSNTALEENASIGLERLMS